MQQPEWNKDERVFSTEAELGCSNLYRIIALHREHENNYFSLLKHINKADFA